MLAVQHFNHCRTAPGVGQNQWRVALTVRKSRAGPGIQQCLQNCLVACTTVAHAKALVLHKRDGVARTDK